MSIRTTIIFFVVAVAWPILIVEFLKTYHYLDETENETEILPWLPIMIIACKWMKCCDTFVLNIHGEHTLINRILQDKIHGQNLAIDAMITSVKSNYDRIMHGSPITMELYGPPGTGKTYSSTLLAEAIFSGGMDTPLVHAFDGTALQYTGDQLISYKDNLQNWIAGNLSQCNKNMFIFWHTEIIPEDLLQVVKDAMQSKKGGIFVFTTTETSPIVSQLYHDHLKLGIRKKFMRNSHFRPAFTRPLFSMTERILFLPMERKDLIYCMLDSFESHGIFVPPKSLEEKIFDQITLDKYGYTNITCKDIVRMVDQIYKVSDVPDST